MLAFIGFIISVGFLFYIWWCYKKSRVERSWKYSLKLALINVFVVLVAIVLSGGSGVVQFLGLGAIFAPLVERIKAALDEEKHFE